MQFILAFHTDSSAYMVIFVSWAFAFRRGKVFLSALGFLGLGTLAFTIRHSHTSPFLFPALHHSHPWLSCPWGLRLHPRACACSHLSWAWKGKAKSKGKPKTSPKPRRNRTRMQAKTRLGAFLLAGLFSTGRSPTAGCLPALVPHVRRLGHALPQQLAKLQLRSRERPPCRDRV